MKTQQHKLYSLQYLRFFAALAVVYSHAVQQHDAYTAWLPYYGDIGVDIFFIISGFIMVWITTASSDTPKKFFIKRVRRIVPLYWFFTLLMAMLFLALPSMFRDTNLEFVALLKSLFFIPHWHSGNPDKVWPLLIPGWSLIYEMYFYLIFAISLWFPSFVRVFFTSAIIVGVFIAANLAPVGSAIQEFMKQSIVLEFVLGMLLALVFKYLPHQSKSTGRYLIGVGILLLVAQPLMLDVPLPRVIQFGVAACVIVAGVLYCSFNKNRFGLLLGDSSYALYLSHGFVLGGLRAVLPVSESPNLLAAWSYLVVATLTSIAAGIVVHLVVDNWLLRKERVGWLNS